jgi:putative peptide zinc metalloprotease protein
LPLRARPDLVISRQQYRGQVYWIIKDPVAMRYYRLRDEEYEILRMLDGSANADDIVARFERTFVPRRLHPQRLQSFLGQLYRQGLLLSESSGQGRELLAQHVAWRRGKLVRTFSNLLAIRLTGIDPEPWLSGLYRRVRWLFSPPAAVAAALLVLTALLLIAIQFDTLLSRLPALDQFFQLSNAAWLVAALALSKILHELGHALACKHFGGECHEVGILLLAGIPCLYCDVSDVWMIPSKWRRAAVGAAGMAVEAVLAAICALLWWYTRPGMLNSLCLALAIACSVSTIVLNGNPLLRYDGYYILGDLAEVPNLWQRSRDALRTLLLQVMLGVSPPAGQPQLGRQRTLLASWGLLSIAYGWFVLLAVLWFAYRALGHHRLDLLAQGLVGLALVGVLTPSAWRVIRFFRTPARIRLHRGRTTLSLAILALLLGAAIFVPLPQRIGAPMIVQPRGAQSVYASVPGILESIAVRPGDRVAAGQTLARLTNREVDLDVVRLKGQLRLQQTHVQNLHRERVTDPSSASQIPQAEETLRQLERQLRQREEDQARLTLTAPAAGVVLPPPSRRKDTAHPDELPPRTPESALRPESVGSYLEVGATFCQIGDPRRWEAILAIDQQSIELTRPGQRVEMKLDELPGETFAGEVLEIAEVDLEHWDQRAADSKPFDPLSEAATAEDIGAPATRYRAQVSFDTGEFRVLQGFRGQAKVSVTPEPALTRLLRAVRHTFRFDR